MFSVWAATIFFGLAAHGGMKDHPCQKIVDACAEKGFVRGDTAGKSLWKDCVDPVMQGQTRPPTAKTQLPDVDKQLIVACKNAHGTLGAGQPTK